MIIGFRTRNLDEIYLPYLPTVFYRLVSKNIDINPWNQAKHEMLDDKTKKAPQCAKLLDFIGRGFETLIEFIVWESSQIKLIGSINPIE